MRGRVCKMLRKISKASDNKVKYPTLKTWWNKLNHREKGAIKQ